MSQSADAAEQIVRISLEGAEVGLRIVGAGAKGLLELIIMALSQKNKTKGQARLATMLKSGKELKVFSVKESDIKKFASEAKRYGILYNVIKNTKSNPDGLVDVMVRAEDAAKIDRIVERFKFATVDVATVKHDIEQSKAAKAQAAPEKTAPQKGANDKTVEDILAPIQKETPDAKNPTAAKTDKAPLSEPTSNERATKNRGTTKGTAQVDKKIGATKSELDKPSYRKIIADKRQERQKADNSKQGTERSKKVTTRQSNKPANTKKPKVNGR